MISEVSGYPYAASQGCLCAKPGGGAAEIQAEGQCQWGRWGKKDWRMEMAQVRPWKLSRRQKEYNLLRFSKRKSLHMMNHRYQRREAESGSTVGPVLSGHSVFTVSFNPCNPIREKLYCGSLFIPRKLRNLIPKETCRGSHGSEQLNQDWPEVQLWCRPRSVHHMTSLFHSTGQP